MHIPDGFIDGKTAATTALLSAAGVWLALRQARRRLPPRRVPLLGLAAAFLFAAQMVNFPVAGGTSGHLVGGVLVAALLGPSAAIVVLTTVLIVQCFLAIQRMRPELASEVNGPAPPRQWGELVCYGLLAVLGIAIFVAPFACPWPDGLESVAARLGFGHKAAQPNRGRASARLPGARRALGRRSDRRGRGRGHAGRLRTGAAAGALAGAQTRRGQPLLQTMIDDWVGHHHSHRNSPVSRLPARLKLGVALVIIVVTVLVPPRAVGWFARRGLGPVDYGGVEPDSPAVSAEAAGLAIAIDPERGVGQRVAAHGARRLGRCGRQEHDLSADDHTGVEHDAVQPDPARPESRESAGLADHDAGAHAPLPVRAGGGGGADAPGASQPHVHAAARCPLAGVVHRGGPALRPRFGAGGAYL